MNRGRTVSTLGGAGEQAIADVLSKADKEDKPGASSKGWKWASLAAALIVLCFLLTRSLTAQDIGAGLTHLKQNRVQLLPVFLVGQSLLVVMAFPPSILQTVAGAIWGDVLVGASIGFIGTFSGQVMAFSLGRYWFRDSMSAWLKGKVPSWGTIENALFLQGGIRLVLLLRLSPVMPDSVLNYALSTTSISTGVFASATALAMIPWSILYAYIGTTSSDIAKTIQDGGAGDDDTPGLKLGIAAVSLVMVMVMVLYVGVMLKNIMAQAAVSTAADDAGSDDDDEETGKSSSRQPLLSGTVVERQSALAAQASPRAVINSS